MSGEYKTWTLEKLLRKANQEWAMAELARKERDSQDEKERIELARMYEQEARDRK